MRSELCLTLRKSHLGAFKVAMVSDRRDQRPGPGRCVAKTCSRGRSDTEVCPDSILQNTSDTIHTTASTSSHHPAPSQASLALQPATPSGSTRDSFSTFVSNTTPTSGKRSKNPLNFFRKKSNVNIREDGSECSPNCGCREARMTDGLRL